ncbi:unnamed protein product [Paramecium sonneborni]|uniref:Uncharacterized protein n=1 Tax=Paramecium sonneborni TaxID=65129 RepID=A0A8S1MCX6_9CILI|nr:unnamed protein product [Paramecium sonneborni]
MDTIYILIEMKIILVLNGKCNGNGSLMRYNEYEEEKFYKN